MLSHDLAGADGTKLRSQGYSYQYTTATKAAPPDVYGSPASHQPHHHHHDTRTYGGSVADLNNDGFLDLMTINEDSADIRIFINKGATGTATSQYNAFVQPHTKSAIARALRRRRF